MVRIRTWTYKNVLEENKCLAIPFHLYVCTYKNIDGLYVI